MEIISKVLIILHCRSEPGPSPGTRCAKSLGAILVHGPVFISGAKVGYQHKSCMPIIATGGCEKLGGRTCVDRRNGLQQPNLQRAFTSALRSEGHFYLINP